MRAVTSICVILLALARFNSEASAATSPLWGDLKPGAHAIGYRVIYGFDRSRTWQGSPDRLGHKLG